MDILPHSWDVLYPPASNDSTTFWKNNRPDVEVESLLTSGLLFSLCPYGLQPMAVSRISKISVE